MSELTKALRSTSGDRLLRICWPPDAVCLSGGCLHCQDFPTNHTVSRVAEFAAKNGKGDDFAFGLGYKWAARYDEG